MKNIFRACIATLLMVSASVASAATLTHNFTDTNNANFSIKNSFAVDAATPGVIKVVSSNGTAYTYQDSSGALLVKLINYMAASGSYFQLAGQQVWMNVTETTQITCSGGTSYFGYPSGGYIKAVADSCAARNSVIAQSN